MGNSGRGAKGLSLQLYLQFVCIGSMHTRIPLRIPVFPRKAEDRDVEGPSPPPAAVMIWSETPPPPSTTMHTTTVTTLPGTPPPPSTSHCYVRGAVWRSFLPPRLDPSDKTCEYFSRTHLQATHKSCPMNPHISYSCMHTCISSSRASSYDSLSDDGNILLSELCAYIQSVKLFNTKLGHACSLNLHKVFTAVCRQYHQVVSR